MKVVCVLGSPRPKGNSSTMAKAFCDEARSLGAQVDVFELNKMNYRGCQGCDSCKTKLDHCALNDDLAPVLELIKACDVLVLATPVYYFDVTGQMKCFIDRCYSFGGPNFLTDPDDYRLPKGQKLVILQSQGAVEDLYGKVTDKYAGFFRFAGFAESTLIRACTVMEPGEVADRTSVMDQVRTEAKRLMA